jgi:hypothetical protein
MACGLLQGKRGRGASLAALVQSEMRTPDGDQAAQGQEQTGPLRFLRAMLAVRSVFSNAVVTMYGRHCRKNSGLHALHCQR